MKGNRLSLQFKLIAILLLSALVPLMIVAVISLNNASDSLKQAEYNKLTAVKEIKKKQIESFFQERFGDILVYSANSSVRSYFVSFVYAFAQERNIQSEAWKQLDRLSGPRLKQFVDEYGYYDLFFISQNGDVVYTVAKEGDLGQNVVNGRLASSNLAKAFKQGQSGISLVDYEYYEISKEPASFLACPITGEGEQSGVSGVMVLQISTQKINELMQELAGMGETGETYLVGSDYYMRSDSRFTRQGETTILQQRIDTKAVNEALNGKNHTELIKDYRGQSVLSSYSPVNIQGLKWVIVSEIDEAEAFKAVSLLMTVSFIIVGVTALILILFGIFFARSIAVPINKLTDTLKGSSSQIATASNQLSSSSQEIANGATEQASSIEETTSSMEELASMVKQNVSTAQEASNLAEKASGFSKEGYTQMEKMLESMTEINKSSDQIKKIIKVIDDIAFQTNILALNAAVEAARAGEAGMGFAVVADEVKNLANRSAEAAKETSAMIEDSIKRTESGVQIASKMAEVFKEILNTVQKVTEMTREVETASKQQDSGINQVNKAIVQFDEVVQANASSAEETASSAEELLAQVENLNEIVRQMVLLVTGKMTEIDTLRIGSLKHKENRIKYDIRKKLTEKQADRPQSKKLADHSTSTAVGVKKREISPEKLIPFEEDEDLKEE